MDVDNVKNNKGMFDAHSDKNKRIKPDNSGESREFKNEIQRQAKKLQRMNQVPEERKSGMLPTNNTTWYHGTILLNTLNLHKSTVDSLKELSIKQNTYLMEKRYSDLFNTRHEKEDLLQNLKKRSNEIKYYYENWNAWRNQLSESERNRMIKITEWISGVIEEVLFIEAENKILLEKRKNELADELGAFNFYHDSLFSVFENKN